MMRFERPFTTRRRLLTALTVSTAVAGCTDHLPIGGDRAELPPFEAAWINVRTDGTTAVRLAFDEAVEDRIDSVGVDEGDLFEQAPFDISLEAVDIEHAPDRPESHTIEGVIHDFVTTQDNWPGATWHVTGLLSLTTELPVESPSFYVRFPSGYEYTLPRAHRQVDEGPIAVDREGNKVLVNYGDPEEYPRSRTIPAIEHYDHEALVWMRTYAEYRHRILLRSIPLYEFSSYNDDAVAGLRDGVADVASFLAERAITSILTSGVPAPEVVEAAERVETLRDIHEAFTHEFLDFRAGLEGLETLAFASGNQDWMSVLTPREGDGLPELARLSEIEWKVRNPLLATAHDRDEFAHQLDAYEDMLDEQRAITQAILSDSAYVVSRGFGNDEWRQLKREADRLVRRCDTLVTAEREALIDLRAEFS